jgi:hypothetical protein
MPLLADFIIDQNRWLGRYVLPVVGIAALVWFAKRKDRPNWATGAVIATAAFVVLFACFFVRAHLFWKPKPGAWIQLPPAIAFVWFSALPTQTVFNWLVGRTILSKSICCCRHPFSRGAPLARSSAWPSRSSSSAFPQNGGPNQAPGRRGAFAESSQGSMGFASHRAWLIFSVQQVHAHRKTSAISSLGSFDDDGVWRVRLRDDAR